MTQTATVYTSETDSEAAGRAIGEQIRTAFGGSAPHAVIVFASARFDHARLLEALVATSEADVIVGASSAGEFTAERGGEGTASALGVRSDSMRFAAGVGTGVSADRQRAARSVLSTFEGLDGEGHGYRSAIVLTDALAGHADDLVDQLTLLTAGAYQFAGGGAGDDARFERTPVFHGARAYTDAVVALEILSDRPIGIGVGHGWTPASKPFRVTEADEMRLVSLDGMPAADAFEEHARATKQLFERGDPMPFFLHNILGIETDHGHRLRVPLVVHEDGSVSCAAEIPSGARVRIMKTTTESAAAAAQAATEAALAALSGERPGAALFFDCVATRLRLGDAFGLELESVRTALSGAHLVGCNTHGQIARAEGQFGGFHNCTAVILILPE